MKSGDIIITQPIYLRMLGQTRLGTIYAVPRQMDGKPCLAIFDQGKITLYAQGVVMGVDLAGYKRNTVRIPYPERCKPLLDAWIAGLQDFEGFVKVRLKAPTGLT